MAILAGATGSKYCAAKAPVDLQRQHRDRGLRHDSSQAGVDVDVDNSAMHVIGGSDHHAQPTFRDSTAAENNVLFQTVDNAADYGDPPVALEMWAGQISLHSDWILHGSEPNGSNRRRCGLAMRYLSADVRAYDGWNANSIWCRGTDAGGHWPTTPAPTANTSPPPTTPRRTPSETHPSAANADRAWPTGQGRLAQATCVSPVVPSASGPAAPVGPSVSLPQ